jgi:homospermidine synthase
VLILYFIIQSGHVQPGTSIEAWEKLQKDHKVGSLKETILKERRKEWKMTKIVFVHSCREGKVPDHLIDCLLRILRQTDPKTAMPKCKLCNDYK